MCFLLFCLLWCLLLSAILWTDTCGSPLSSVPLYCVSRVTTPPCWPMGRRAQGRVTPWWATGQTKAWCLHSATGSLRLFGKTKTPDSARWAGQSMCVLAYVQRADVYWMGFVGECVCCCVVTDCFRLTRHHRQCKVGMIVIINVFFFFIPTQVFFSMLEIYNEQVKTGERRRKLIWPPLVFFLSFLWLTWNS